MGRPSKRGTWAGTWEGGRVWRGADGVDVYYIRRQVGGQRYSCSTGATTRRAALVQLGRFEGDPDHYRPANDPATAPLYLDNDLSEAFLAWSKGALGNSLPWVNQQKSVLAWWMERLAGVNLRRANLRDHILPKLEGAPGRAQKIRVLKTLFSYLRKERHLLAAHEDPTYGALSAPPSKPAQWTKSKVIPLPHYLLVRDLLRSEEEARRATREERKRAGKVVSISTGETVEEEGFGPWADALVVQAGTGWHTTELVRFSASGSIEALPKSMKIEHGAVGVLVCPMHKSGDVHRTAVSQEVLDAAKRLREHGAFSREWYDRAVRAACKAVTNPDGTTGIPVFTPGRFRHSVASWAFEAGADPFAVSAFLGHKSASTTRKFYASLATVPKVPTLA